MNKKHSSRHVKKSSLTYHLSSSKVELVRENKQITSILESINDAFISFDHSFRYIYVNTKAEKILQKKRSKLIGKSMFKEFPLLSKEHPVYKHMLDSIKSGKSLKFEYRTNQTKKWYEIKIFPSSDGVSIYFSDITKQKIAEEKLKQSELLYRMVVEHSSDLIALIDTGTTILYASPSHQNILGYKPSLLIGKNGLQTLVHPDDIPIAKKALGTAVTKGVAKTTFRLKKKTGDWVTIDATGTLFSTFEGKQMIIMTSHDVTERAELEKRKDEFISMAGHELKTPVTSQKLFLDVLQKQVQQYDDERANKIIFRLKDQTERLRELISELLDLSRIQTGKLHFHNEIFDVCELVEDTVEGLQGTASRHTIVYKRPETVMVYADRFRLYQVITNLITNAVKYSPKGNKIVVSLTSDKEFVTISVKDFGIGIPKSYQNKIFERLFQIPHANEKTYPGLGMGLYISKDIVERHGGKIWLKSVKNKGTTFYFSLPLYKESK